MNYNHEHLLDRNGFLTEKVNFLYKALFQSPGGRGSGICAEIPSGWASVVRSGVKCSCFIKNGAEIYTQQNVNSYTKIISIKTN